jgi:hypothetical protein
VSSLRASARRCLSWPLVASPLLLLLAGCLNVDTPYTWVDLENQYPPAGAAPVVVYQANWQAVAFTTPLPPGSSTGAQPTVPASDNTAYALLAPGWDPTSTAPPATFVVVQSRAGYSVHLGDTLDIPVSDTTFAGDCAAGSPLTQPQADFLTQVVYASAFQGQRYDAATCKTTPIGDAGAE